MPSSDRHLLRGGQPQAISTLDAADGTSGRPDPPDRALAAPAAPSVLRGRVRGSRASRGAGASGTSPGGRAPGGQVFAGHVPAGQVPAGQAPYRDAAGMADPIARADPAAIRMADPAAVGRELQQMRRIAEERGYAAGRQRAETELEVAIAAAGALAQRIEALAPVQTSRVAHAISELGLAVARRILEAEVSVDPTILCASLEAAVAAINGSPEARVMLHPAAVARVREAWEAAHGVAFLGKRWTFEADPALPPGGCTLRYDHGFVEAGLEAQLEEIGMALDRAIPGLSATRGSEDAA